MFSRAARGVAAPAFRFAAQVAARAAPREAPWLYRGLAFAGSSTAVAGFAVARPGGAASCEAGVDWAAVRKEIVQILDDDKYTDSSYLGATPGPLFLRLAWHSAGTFCKHTGTGGSDGATMRFEPEVSWGANAGLKKAQDMLEPVKKKFPAASYSDLWIYSAVVAIEEMGGPAIPFTPGRTDKASGKECPAWEGETHKVGRLPGADMGSPDKTAAHLRYIFNRMGFDDREGKPWTGPMQFEDPTGDLMMLPSDIVLIQDKGFRKYVELYAKDSDAFMKDFGAAVGKLFDLGCKGSKKKGWFS